MPISGIKKKYIYKYENFWSEVEEYIQEQLWPVYSIQFLVNGSNIFFYKNEKKKKNFYSEITFFQS